MSTELPTRSARQERVQLLARQNRGRHTVKSFAQRLHSILGVSGYEPAFLSLEETDRLYATWAQSLRTHYSDRGGCADMEFVESDAQPVISVLDSLAARESEYVIAFQNHYEDYGAIKLPSGVCFTHALDLLSLDGNSLRIVSESADCGLLLDRFEHTYYDIGHAGDMILELAVWGDRWRTAL